MAKLTRRTFLAGTAAAAAAAAGLAACDGGAADIYAAPDAASYPIEPDGEGVEALWTAEQTRDGWTRVTAEGAPELGIQDASKIIQVNGLAFKDLNGNGKLDLYEDWRQPAEARAAALASMLAIEEVAPLMFHGDFSLSGSQLEDSQTTSINQGMRAGVLRGGSSADNYAIGVSWTNALQALCESNPYGIPYWNSTDAYRFSNLPSCLTIAATFDPENARRMANYLSKGWRSVGITCELGPEVDVASNPAYSRFSGCFSDDPALTRDMGRAYADGLQSTWDGDTDLGWGAESVSAMFKHYPGDAACEGGRNSHNRTGEFMAFPNDNLSVGLVPYIDGGLRLEGKTGKIAAIMPNYAICYTEDEHYGENVATAYNKYVLSLIRDAGWDGAIVTDWQISQDEYFGGAFEGRHFGVDDLTPEERIAKGYNAGTDQFGGEFQPDQIPAIIKLMQDELGEEGALARYRESARRLFVAEMNLGLFENPYIEQAATKAFWESTEAAEFAEGLLPKCVVMLKNRGGIIKAASGEKPTVYVPMVFTPGQDMGPRGTVDPMWSCPIDVDAASAYVNVVTDTLLEPSGTKEVYQTGGMTMGPTGPVMTERDPDEVPEIVAVYTEDDCQRASAEEVAAADYLLVFASGPSIGEGSETGPDGTVTYLPMNLQYGAYTADGPNVRQVSIAGETLPDGSKENRSYYGQTNPGNTAELDKILSARELAGDKPVIVALSSGNPMIFSEFEDQVDAILYTPGASDGIAIAKIVAGEVEPSGLLPYQMPANMDTVEANAEDTPRDLDVYVDSEGNGYDFGFGLNWSGVIDDERTATYKVSPIIESENA